MRLSSPIDSTTFRTIAKAVNPSVVNIRTESKQKGQDLSDFFGGGGGGGGGLTPSAQTLEATAATSTGPEVLRGLGYWLDYVRDEGRPTTSAAQMLQSNLPVMLAGFTLVAVCMLPYIAGRWHLRRYGSLLIAIGTVLLPEMSSRLARGDAAAQRSITRLRGCSP